MKVSQFKEISSMYLNKMKKPVIRNGVYCLYILFYVFIYALKLIVKTSKLEHDK